MKKIAFVILLLIFSIPLKAQSTYFPPLVGDIWDTISPKSLGWCEKEIEPLYNYLEQKNTKAFILLKDGKIVLEKYFNSFTKDSAWYWASAGKTLTAFTVGIAQQEKFFSLNDKSSTYLGTGWTVCTPQQEDKITIHHQLTMTTGLNDGVPDHFCTLDTCLEYLADAGTRWAYHNGPYTLLDKIIEKTTGQSLNSYFTQKIKSKTGITGTFIPSGYNNVFYSKARSMARFGLLILNKGNWNGNQIMSDTNYFNQMVTPSQTFNKSYGYLWWLNGKATYMVPNLQLQFKGPLNQNAPDDMIAALGKNGQIINISPSKNLVYIRMGDAPGVGEVPILFNDTIWQKLNDIMCNINSIHSHRSANEVRIYPNPAKNNLCIELNQQHFNIELIDYIGRVIYVQNNCFNKVDLNIHSFQNGYYTVCIKNKQRILYSKKLIIAN
jgi:CubicO group peptidase (beta-lactamase class C family)